MTRKFPNGRAPPRSRRSKLIDKGYSTAQGSFGNLNDARAAAKKMQEKGYLAQAVKSANTPMTADWGTTYWVMYKKKVK